MKNLGEKILINIIDKLKGFIKIFFYLLLIWFILKLVCHLEWITGFEQPVSLFAYHLIALHNSIMYYVIIILSLVYW